MPVTRTCLACEDRPVFHALQDAFDHVDAVHPGLTIGDALRSDFVPHVPPVTQPRRCWSCSKPFRPEDDVTGRAVNVCGGCIREHVGH